MTIQVSPPTRQVFWLLLTVIALVYVPYLGLYFHEGEIPPGYFKYPPVEEIKKPEFHLGVFLINAGIGLLIILLYIFPRIFGFKKVPNPNPIPVTRSSLPSWFYIGVVMFTIPMALLVTQASEPRWLINWALVPIFWGFTLILDGIVYYFNNRRSMINNSPTELVALGVVSISGWMFFDYLNFFIHRNWYYPKASLVGMENNEFLVYALVGSSGFIPMAFQWYFLLRKVRVLNTKYTRGPKMKAPRWLLFSLIALSLFGLWKIPALPDSLFFFLWLGPLIILVSVLTLLKIWTPFTAIQKGDWTALLTFALTYLIQGILLEWWNYMSAEHLADGSIRSYNAAYWIYCLPYINKFLIFEMPLLGYMGYLFFSIHCYLWWIITSKLMGIATPFSDEEDFK